MIRFRWYGSEPSRVFVERKVHHEPWVLQCSLKERFELQESQVLPFIQVSGALGGRSVWHGCCNSLLPMRHRVVYLALSSLRIFLVLR